MRKIDTKGCLGKLMACAIALSFPYCAFAQQAPIGFSAEAALAAGTDSNVLRLSDNETSDTILEVAPQLNFVELYGKHRFEAKYEGDYVRFSDFDSLNYSDHRATLNAKLEHTTRFRTEFTYKYEDIVELPGINNSVTQALEEYNQVDQQNLTAKMTYGRNDAAGQGVFRYDHRKRDYTNNNQDFRDYTLNRVIATFYYRISPNTRLLLEASDSNLSYDTNTFNPGSIYKNYLIGAEWRPSAKTRGIIKVGQQDQDFDRPEFSDISGLAYYLDIFWQPNTYSLIQIGASRATRESSEIGVGSFVVSDFTVKVQHELTSRLSVNAFYTYGEDDVVLSDNVNLKRQHLEFKLLHENNKWFDSFIGLEYFTRDSDESVYSIKTNQITVGIIGYFGRRKNQ